MIDSMTSARERIGRLDVVIAVLASLFAAAYMSIGVIDDTYDNPPLTIPVFVLVTVPLLWRRSAPLAATAGALAALLLHAAIFGEVVRCGIALPVAFVLAFACGARHGVREALAGLGFALAIGVAVCLTDGPDGAGPEAITFTVPLTLAVWGAGRLVRSRARAAQDLALRTDELREARDERARLEVATDRARLAAELDELLRRRVGDLARLADATGPDAADAGPALAVIERESRRTLDEMRALVGSLRTDEDMAEREPQPTLAHLEALLLRAKGDDVRLHVEGSPRVLPAGVELTAYRVIEHLLDAVDDHGIGVCVRFADDALELEVTGTPRRRADDSIERARARVQAQSGTLNTARRDGRAEAIATLPLTV
jgi:hypothetical protein